LRGYGYRAANALRRDIGDIEGLKCYSCCRGRIKEIRMNNNEENECQKVERVGFGMSLRSDTYGKEEIARHV
jgi:hypothetical protein